MADEAQVRIGITAQGGNMAPQFWQPQPTTFTADVSQPGGPVPGQLLVPTTGLDVSFSPLVMPGLCRIMNLDTDNFVDYGLRDTVNNVAYLPFRLLPGEFYLHRFSDHIGHGETGTGTTPNDATVFHVRANLASCKVQVEAIET
jgi:hypothetical protein